MTILNIVKKGILLREYRPVSSEMKCLASNSKFDTDGEIDAKSAVGEKLQLMAFHVEFVHTSEPVQSNLH